MVSKKKQLFTRFIAIVLSVIILISPVYADVLIDYNGSTNTGGSQGGAPNKSGFLIPSADKNSDLIYGYRFSIWDENGNKKALPEGDPSKTIDIFIKSTTLGTLDYRGGIVRQGASSQTSKKEWAVNNGVTVMDATSFVDIRQVESPSFETALPSGADVTKEKLEEWITNAQNRVKLYQACGLESSAIKGTDYVLVEPLVAIKLDNKGLIVTPTDIAMVGVRIYGVDYNGRNVEIKYGTLGYLASYVNGIYAHPYSSYERGTNEKQNSLVRRFFPKGKSFDNITDEQVAFVENWINNLPRKIFNYHSADFIFNSVLFDIAI